MVVLAMESFGAKNRPDVSTLIWLAVGWAAFALLPWYAVDAGFFAFHWLSSTWPVAGSDASGLFLGLGGEKPWLAPLAFFLLVPIVALRLPSSSPYFSVLLIASGLGGLAYLAAQGVGIGLRGWNFAFLEALFGQFDNRQFGMGYGAMGLAFAFLFIFTRGVAARGAIKGDVFVVGTIGLVIALVSLFILMPVFQMLAAALRLDNGAYSVAVFLSKFFNLSIWRIDCLIGGARCGIAWNSLFLAIVVGVLTTLLGLAFALLVTRTGFRFSKALKVLTVLPIITPPFVIGLAIILMFGLSGTVTRFTADLFGVAPSRWIYGFPGLVLAQVLAFTPLSFLVLIGVVEGVSPSMEEAAQTLRANRWQTFVTVSLPLMKPGLANAFLLGFIESMSDFGNPMVLGGNYDVLATEIFFAIVGAQNDAGRAAVLALILLCFTLTAFYAQRFWLGRKSYTTLSGKGDSGQHPQLPRKLAWPLFAVTGFWTIFTVTIYVMIVYGSFVELWGVRNDLTVSNYVRAFGIGWTEHGLHWRGSAWSSFWTTLQIAAISAPLTAAIGLLTAWLLVRQEFAGKSAFEFGTMLSFAVPGTVIGVAYIVAFNVPPIELTGTAIILIISFVFRNMPVGVRAGIASMSQLDRSLDEASLTLGAGSFQTLRQVILPLLKPAILAALVYSFVSAMTAISAVIFLVSARHDMATTYIIGRVENNEYGVAIAYSTVLIIVMLAVIGLFQLVIGNRALGRRTKLSGVSMTAGGGG